MTSFYEELRKSDTVSDEQENAQSRASIDKWIFRLLLFLMGFMPLVVMANVEEVISPLVSNIDVLSSGVKGDLFTHYKALLVLVITIITGAMLLVKIYFMGGTIKKTWLNYVLGVFVVAIVVSTVMSPNISIALNGLYNRSDGAISWLCYVTLMFIAMNIDYPKNIVKYIMYTMMPFVYINLYIITMNFYGKDLLQNGWMQKLVSLFLPEGANISEGSQLVGTLNQWNYMSGMFAMMTVMYLAWVITSKKWVESILGAVTASASISVLFMSVSTSGFLTLLVMLVVLAIVLIFIENKKQSIISIVLFLVISVPVFHLLAEKDPNVWWESFGLFTNSNPYADDVVSFISRSNVAYASDSSFELPILPERETGAGSGRLYIWEKSLNLVEDRILFGYGADSLVYTFPHYNIDARSALWSEDVITDKPHNSYVGILYGFGIFAFVAAVVILIVSIIEMLINIWKKYYELLAINIVAVAYFAQAMFNDSIPSATTFVFILLGIAFALKNNSFKEN